jgi:hypothetical protein
VPSEYATIQAAVDASIAGDTVLVAPGTYSDYTNRVVDGFLHTATVFLKDAVILQSESGPEVTLISIDGSGHLQPNTILGYGLVSGSTVVQGFSISGTGITSAARIADGNWITFQDCIFRNVEIGLSAIRADLRVEGCTFRECDAGLAGLMEMDTQMQFTIEPRSTTRDSSTMMAVG